MNDPSGILVSSGADWAGNKNVAGILLVDPAGGNTLTLNGGGEVALTGGTITGVAANDGDTLVNSNNTIYGYGLISNLTATNDATIGAANGTLTLDGLVVANDDAIDAGLTTTATLLVDGGTVISGSMLTIGAAGTLDVETLGGSTVNAPDATLDGIIVNDGNATAYSTTTNSGIEIAAATSGAILTLEGGAQIDSTDGGTLTIGSSGTLHVGTLGGSTLSKPDATIDGIFVTDNNAGSGTYNGIEISDATSGAILELGDGTTISGGSLAVELGGVLEITDSTGATLDHVVVDNDGTGSGLSSGIYVASGVLTLDGDTQIQGGPTATAGTLTIASAAQVTVDGAIGTVGAWQDTSALATGEPGATAVVGNGYVYEIGGNNPADATLVQYAPINADGACRRLEHHHAAPCRRGRIRSHVRCRQRLRL